MPQTRRIVSLVPSLSETIVKLGLRSELIACTSFCIEPKSLTRDLVVVGGTKDFDVEKILALQPTHIIANQEENTKEGIEALIAKVPTLVTFPRAPADVPEMLRDIGNFLGCRLTASKLAMEIEEEIKQCSNIPATEKRLFLYFIWQNPYMIAGRDTYISSLLNLADWENASNESTRYPIVSIDDIKRSHVTEILLSSEPFPFRKRHANTLKEQGINKKIYWIDGRTCSWFGWRTLEAIKQIRRLREHTETKEFIRLLSSQQ